METEGSSLVIRNRNRSSGVPAIEKSMSANSRISPFGATDPSNNLSEIGEGSVEVLQDESVTKCWSMNEQVQPLSIRTLNGLMESDSTRMERTSWQVIVGKVNEENTLQKRGLVTKLLSQHGRAPLADVGLCNLLTNPIGLSP